MIIGNRTLSTRYILPFLFTDKKYFTDKYSFINAYIQDINRPYLEDKIFIVFEYDPKVYSEINNEMTSNSYYFTKYDLHMNNKYYIEYVFVIPPKYNITIKNIIDGKFNYISAECKINIISFWGNMDLSYLKDLLKNPKDLLDIISLEERNEIITEEDYYNYDYHQLIRKFIQ